MSGGLRRSLTPTDALEKAFYADSGYKPATARDRYKCSWLAPASRWRQHSFRWKRRRYACRGEATPVPGNPPAPSSNDAITMLAYGLLALAGVAFLVALFAILRKPDTKP